MSLPLPPLAMRFMGESDERFLATGTESVAELREVVGLGDRERLLDVGCGYGRLAHALLRDGGFAGTYLGIDILPGPVQWCQEELAPRSDGRFCFRQIDVANERYRPEGGTPPQEAELGVEPGSFDVVALISVFTHLDPPAVERYLHLIAAALAPGGRAFISAFLLNRSWRELEEAGRSPIPMSHRLTSFCRYRDPDDPLHAIGYKPAWLVARAEEAGLELHARPRLGAWCGRPDGVGHLDVLPLRRPGGRPRHRISAVAEPVDFAASSRSVTERLAEGRERIDTTIAPGDQMYRGDLEDYLGVCHSALAQIGHAMAISGRTAPRRILDFACGHGRVLRGLRAAFPEAELTGADVDRDGVDFCAQQFGSLPLYSDPDPARVRLVGGYDLIWVGSLFTHLDAERCREFLDLLRRNLAEGGLLLFSTHGRNAVDRWPLDNERMRAIVTDFEREGFGYRDHPGVEGYGTSAFTAAWIAAQLEPWTDLMLIGYMERGLADHQDVVSLLKTDVHHPQNELLVV